MLSESPKLRQQEKTPAIENPSKPFLSHLASSMRVKLLISTLGLFAGASSANAARPREPQPVEECPCPQEARPAPEPQEPPPTRREAKKSRDFRVGASIGSSTSLSYSSYNNNGIDLRARAGLRLDETAGLDVEFGFANVQQQGELENGTLVILDADRYSLTGGASFDIPLFKSRLLDGKLDIGGGIGMVHNPVMTLGSKFRAPGDTKFGGVFHGRFLVGNDAFKAGIGAEGTVAKNNSSIGPAFELEVNF